MIFALLKKILKNPFLFVSQVNKKNITTLIKAIKAESFNTILDNFYSLIYNESLVEKKNRHYNHFLKKWKKKEQLNFLEFSKNQTKYSRDLICFLAISFEHNQEKDQRITSFIEAQKIPCESVFLLFNELGQTTSALDWIHCKTFNKLKEEIGKIKAPYIFFLDDRLTYSKTALFECLEAIENIDNLGLVYADHDRMKGDQRFDHHFKPDWNPFLILSQNYIHFPIVVHRSSLLQIWETLEVLDPNYHYHIILEMGHLQKVIHHIPKLLYTLLDSGGVKDPFLNIDLDLRVVNSYLSRVRENVSIRKNAIVPVGDLIAAPDKMEQVSIIIPFKNGLNFLRDCVNSILQKTSYQPYEIVLVNNQSDEQEVLDYLKSLHTNEKIRYLNFDKSFNFSAINNFAVTQIESPYLIFLNNDTKIITPDWIEQLLALFSFPEVGIVGPRMLYEDGSIQHSGVVLGMGHAAGHIFRTLPQDAKDSYMHRMHSIQNFSAVTAACMMIKKEQFESLGGFDEIHLPIAYNDVDLCLRMQEAGYSIVYQPRVNIYHLESKSRKYDLAKTERERFHKELDYIKGKWTHLVEDDPCFNPNLSKQETSVVVKTKWS